MNIVKDNSRNSPYYNSRNSPYYNSRNSPYYNSRNSPYYYPRNSPYYNSKDHEMTKAHCPLVVSYVKEGRCDIISIENYSPYVI